MRARPRGGGRSSPRRGRSGQDRRDHESGSREISPGVIELDHTADVAITIEAASLDELVHRTAAGVMALMWSGAPILPAELEPRRVTVRAGETDALLVRWLAELLYLLEVEGFVYRSATIESLDERSLAATVWGAVADEPPEMEIKGVTYHGLQAARHAGRWHAQIIFDV